MVALHSYKKINLLIIVDKFEFHGSYINGPSHYFSWVVGRLNKNFFNVTLCSLRAKGKSDEFLLKDNITVKYLGLHKFNPFTFLFISKLLLKENIDIVHLSGYGAATFGRIACFLSRKPAIIQEHWVDLNINKMQMLIERILSRLTYRAIAISGYSKNFLIEKKFIHPDKIIVIPNGIPLENFRISDKLMRSVKKEEFGFSPETKLIGTIGMLHENKGHKYLIEAAHLLKNDFPYAKYLIIGEGELRNELEKMICELELKDRVILLGHRTDIPELLNMLDIFVLSSNNESASLALMEAMAAGKAIITTACGGPCEIIKNGETGFIIPVKNPYAISEKIAFLLQDPFQIEQLGCNALNDSYRFDIDFTVQKLEKFYISINNDLANKNILDKDTLKYEIK